MIVRELYEKYISNNYKLILATGFSPRNKKTEEAARYSEAKKPIETSWNSEGNQKTFDEVRDWLNNGGWISAVLPNNLIAIDVDNKELQKGKSIENIIGLKYKTEQLNMLLENYKYGKHITNNGYHYVFAASTTYKSSSKMFTKAGLAVTYRMGGASNIVVAPSNGRVWETFTDNHELAELPPALQPLKMDSKEEIRGAIACQLRYFWKNDVLQGNEDIDLAFMGLLVKDLKYDMAAVCEFFELIYRNDYDKQKTAANYKVATSKDGGGLLKAGSFFQKLKDKNLNDLAHLVDCLVALEGVDRSAVKDKDNFNELVNRYAFEYAQKRNIIFKNGLCFSRNDDGYYSKYNMDNMKRDFANWLGAKKYRVNIVTQMVCYAQAHFTIENDDELNELLMADKKVFNLETLQIRDLTDNDKFFYRLNVKYNPDAKCERWLQFLKEIWPAETEAHIKFIQQFIGYIFYPKNKFEMSLILRGEGANGKSVLMDTIEYLVGTANVSHLSLSDLKQSFYLVNLQNKLLNMSTEVESKILVSDDIFKQVVSGETVTANIKFKDPIEFRPFCKFIFASNNSITSSDKSKGYERRITFINFPVNFDTMPDKKDVNLRDKLRAEIDGIFVWALTGLRKVVHNNKIEVSEELKRCSKIEHNSTNPVHEFVSNHLYWQTISSDVVMAQKIYDEYKKYCQMCGYNALNYTNFGKSLRGVCKDDLNKFIKRQFNKNGYKNIYLKAVPYNPVTKLYEEILDEQLSQERFKPVTEMTWQEYNDFLNIKF